MDWMDDNSLDCLNPLHTPTWTNPRPDTCPSVLNLVQANNATRFSDQLGGVEISFGDSLGSDHAAVSINIYPLDRLHLVPPPHPAGYCVDTKRKDAWVKEFAMSLPPCLPYTLSYSTVLNNQESMSSR
jgi:hypothetical protein